MMEQKYSWTDDKRRSSMGNVYKAHFRISFTFAFVPSYLLYISNQTNEQYCSLLFIIALFKVFKSLQVRTINYNGLFLFYFYIIAIAAYSIMFQNNKKGREREQYKLLGHR